MHSLQRLNQLTQVKAIPGDVTAFLEDIGEIFTVFDKQDSGCVSYGVVIEGQKWFIKHSIIATGISFMRNAADFHTAIQSKYIPRFVNSFSTDDGRGYALVFAWVEGEVLSSPEFVGASGRNNPLSPYYRFTRLPVEQIMRALQAVYELHTFLESQGYIAVDFYLGSMIYDFAQEQIHFCDFDCYVKGPFVLEQERLPGSTRFMAPEEWVKGSIIDQRTNVFTMGAAAFVLLANSDRSRESWKASEALFRVAEQAVCIDREQRFASVSQFFEQWKQALLA